ncbi:transmembrane protein 81 [Eucyclogobius newberryi]|uniref:transmembrane protein 81 n=1 Tax=Eucyclogobius newberryi TaxID=166745 RepID=UPI003B5AEF19
MIFKFCINVLWVLFILFYGDSQEEDRIEEMATNSTPCSATCGPGIKSFTMCKLKDSKAAVQKDIPAEVTKDCRVHWVECVKKWDCGLRTLTVTAGQKLDLDCVGQDMKEVIYTWSVSWRYAAGVITSVDSLFTKLFVPNMGRFRLDPVEEKHAGTYCCIVQSAAFRRLKKIYWGVRVLLPDDIDLDTQPYVDTQP